MEVLHIEHLSMKKIAVIPGDGVGPEVINEGLKVLNWIKETYSLGFELSIYPFGTEHYLKTKEILPQSAFNEISRMDAIYLGAIGDPRVERGVLERGIIGSLRWDLDLYVNLRPIKLYDSKLTPLKYKTPKDIDFVVVRENTEDMYVGVGGFFKKATPDETSIVNVIYTRKGVERIIRYAYELARSRSKKKRLTLVDKANAVSAHDLWRRVFAEVGKEYTDIEQDSAYVDAMCMWMVSKPEWFDVVVTTNMFGDIITDLGAELCGGMGIAASANIHPGKLGLFEPIHGSAPKYAGKNVACPIAAIMAVQMMLDWFGYNEAACLLERSVISVLKSNEITDLSASSGISTSEMGDKVVLALEKETALAT